MSLLGLQHKSDSVEGRAAAMALTSSIYYPQWNWWVFQIVFLVSFLNKYQKLQNFNFELCRSALGIICACERGVLSKRCSLHRSTFFTIGSASFASAVICCKFCFSRHTSPTNRLGAGCISLMLKAILENPAEKYFDRLKRRSYWKQIRQFINGILQRWRSEPLPNSGVVSRITM